MSNRCVVVHWLCRNKINIGPLMIPRFGSAGSPPGGPDPGIISDPMAPTDGTFPRHGFRQPGQEFGARRRPSLPSSLAPSCGFFRWIANKPAKYSVAL